MPYWKRKAPAKAGALTSSREKSLHWGELLPLSSNKKPAPLGPVFYCWKGDSTTTPLTKPAANGFILILLAIVPLQKGGLILLFFLSPPLAPAYRHQAEQAGTQQPESPGDGNGRAAHRLDAAGGTGNFCCVVKVRP